MLVAAGLGVALLVGAVVTGVVLNGSGAAQPSSDSDTKGPLLLVPVDAPQASSAECVSLLKNLPRQLPDAGSTLNQRAMAKPVQPGAAAWGTGDDPVVLRCGVEQPPEFKATSQLLAVSGVQWLQITGDDAATWYAVDRAATVALTTPGGSGTGPLQEVSATISATMPAVALHLSGN